MKEHWENQRKGCLATFGGGHHDDGKLDAFRHGMETVFNMLQGTNNYVFRSDLERIAEMLAMKEMSRDFVIEFISRTLKERARDYKESAATVAQQAKECQPVG